jgi:hypothetical protein
MPKVNHKLVEVVITVTVHLPLQQSVLNIHIRQLQGVSLIGRVVGATESVNCCPLRLGEKALNDGLACGVASIATNRLGTFAFHNARSAIQ